MNKTKIDWAQFSWNPAWGCRGTCPYCYARRLARRFGESFEPHWKEKNFQRTMPKKPSRIFVNSMSDIAYWTSVWWEKVLAKIRRHPQHDFLFLTKQPDVYKILMGFAPRNCWFGTTITANDFPTIILSADHINFVSIEPILEPVDLRARHNPEKHLDWIIVGAETGNRKGRVIPRLSWIMDIVDYARSYGIPVWLKENLRGIWVMELIQEVPTRGKA